MNVHDISPDPLGNFRLVFKLMYGFLNHVTAGRIQHDELVRVKAGSQLVLANELSAFLKAANDLVTFGQISDLVSTGGMRFDRKNLAVDAKTANAIVGAEVQSGEQGVGIFHAETAQLHQGVGSLHLTDGSGRRRGELDGLIPKQAA
jgi:hypothetical protein